MFARLALAGHDARAPLQGQRAAPTPERALSDRRARCSALLHTVSLARLLRSTRTRVARKLSTNVRRTDRRETERCYRAPPRVAQAEFPAPDVSWSGPRSATFGRSVRRMIERATSVKKLTQNRSRVTPAHDPPQVVEPLLRSLPQLRDA